MRLSGLPLAEPFPITDILRRGLESGPDDDALASLEARWTWRQLDEASNRLASGYLALGLNPGDRIASLVPNRGALIIHYIACMKAGLVAVPLNYRYTAAGIDHGLKASGAAALLAHGERNGDLAAAEEVGDLRCGVIHFESGEASGVFFEDLIGSDIQAQPPANPDPDAPAVIFFTSGSTGAPKGVTHTYRSLGWMFTIIAAGFELTAEDVLLPGSSCSHIGGFAFSFAALGSGARALVSRRSTSDEILKLFRRERPTVLCMIPAALFSVVRDRTATREDFASLRLCRSGADKVPAELEREFVDLTGHEIDEGYGCSEVGLVTLNPPSGKIVLGSVGKALPGVDLSVRDDGGSEIGTGADGNLWIKSPSLMGGYWNDEPATGSAIRDGWLDSGDRMAADEEGYLWFRGRKKQIIVHDGSNIFPQEVEEAIEAHPSVALAGVIGIHDLVHGESVRAYIALRPDVESPTVEALIAHARERVGYKAPEEIVFLEEIPLNPTGKVDRLALKTMAEAAHRHDQGGEPTRGPGAAIVHTG